MEDKVSVIRCRDCKYFEIKDWWYDKSEVPVLCTSDCPTCTKWASCCMTNPNGYCFLAEKRGEEEVQNG